MPEGSQHRADPAEMSRFGSTRPTQATSDSRSDRVIKHSWSRFPSRQVLAVDNAIQMSTDVHPVHKCLPGRRGGPNGSVPPLWSARSPNGSDLCNGIEFLSRHGDDLVLWAPFERTGDRQTNPHVTGIEHHQLNRDTPDLVRAFSFLELRMLPPDP